MSDTPRTDTNSVRFSTLCADLDQWWVSRETARQLERELNAAKARADRLESVLLSRHGGECLQLIDELDAWRMYAESVEEFVDANAAHIDVGHWNALKAGRPTDE